MLGSEVTSYYDRGDEEDRLVTGDGVLEYARTQVLLGRFLPAPPARILDVGGGPGRYAAWLASEGYEVTLIDPVPLHVAQAQARADRRPFRAQLGHARALEFADGSFDAVVMLGPLYHLPERDERVGALREAMRVVRPGGVVVAAGISRFASLIVGVCQDLITDPDYVAIVEVDIRAGQHRATPDGRYFTTAFFHHPDELRAEAFEAGLTDVEILAVEGPWCELPDLRERYADPSRWDSLLHAIELVEREPSLLGASGHIVAIGCRPPGR
jgi:SAM-dependent methyltransferase